MLTVPENPEQQQHKRLRREMMRPTFELLQNKRMAGKSINPMLPANTSKARSFLHT